jgi:hypothetical protein
MLKVFAFVGMILGSWSPGVGDGGCVWRQSGIMPLSSLCMEGQERSGQEKGCKGSLAFEQSPRHTGQDVLRGCLFASFCPAAPPTYRSLATPNCLLLLLPLLPGA